MKQRLKLFVLWLISLTGAALAFLIALFHILFGSERAWPVILSGDQALNAATGGSEDETISSRANRARQEKRTWGCVLCKFLDLIDKDHCRNAAGV